ncbi:MAG: UDP-N-acetylmuramate dehydrogenase [Thermodesulfobacteriota bacterium]|nr:UDP-N-acetylmuramate dehydrogenase [Thermodesulfobacteriota bacterium]
MDSAKFYEKFKDHSNLILRRDEPMKRHTSFRVGGLADLYAVPESLEKLKTLLLSVCKAKLPLTITGSGTNLLVKDGGISGIVVSLCGIKDKIRIRKVDNELSLVTASTGTVLAGVAKFAMDHGLEGLGFAAGIPGTVGGAVMMNAGTGMNSMSSIIESVEIVGPDGKVQKIERNDITFSHRTTCFNTLNFKSENHGREEIVPGNRDISLKNLNSKSCFKPVIVKASFLLKKGDKERIKKDWQELLKKRKNTQPVLIPSAGCFFKNPGSGRTAGELIDRAGLKGTRVGDAMVSEKHANFILNMGNARAEDILKLKKNVEEKVFKLFSVKLDTEVKIEGR